jgi:CheY-like chemotaxis protein
MKTILVVDDDPSIQDVFSIIFDRKKYSVTIYSSPEKILNNIQITSDIIILDKQLSGVDGLDVCRFIKNQSTIRDIPVIMLSASPDISQLAKAAGADAALEKPFSLKTLRSMVVNLIG